MRFPRHVIGVLLLLAGLALGACGDAALVVEPERRPLSVTVSSPLADAHGTHRSLGGLTTVQRAAARALIKKVAVAGRGPKTGYDRERFGPAWTDNVSVKFGRNGCSTREDILRRDLRGTELRSGTGGCVVLTGLLRDPYSGRLIEFSKAQALRLQIDHVVPLSYAWQLAAARWPEQKRRRFANDPLNLLAVEGRLNAQKSASGPASWLPPNKRIRCAYSVRFAQVALKYRMPVTTFDRERMLRQCA